MGHYHPALTQPRHHRAQLKSFLWFSNLSTCGKRQKSCIGPMACTEQDRGPQDAASTCSTHEWARPCLQGLHCNPVTFLGVSFPSLEVVGLGLVQG